MSEPFCTQSDNAGELVKYGTGKQLLIGGCLSIGSWTNREADAICDGINAAVAARERAAAVAALREAADAIVVPGASSVAADWLRTRADAIESGAAP